MTDLKLLHKLAEMKNEAVNSDTIIGYSDEGKPVKVNQIRSLDLENTSILALPDTIAHLENLEYLNVSGTQLISLPDCIGDLSCLKHLNASGTQLTTLPDSIGDLYSLWRLDVSKTNLKSLPDSIGNLYNLRRLYVSRTPLTALPVSIGDLSNLEYLSVKGTPIITLPKSIWSLPSLRSLDASETGLTNLSNSIWKLSNLRNLNVSETKLTTLPQRIGELSNLIKLDVSKNKQITLPDSIRKLSNLRKLNISETEIGDISMLSDLKSLTSLNLQNSAIVAIPEEILNLNLRFITEECKGNDWYEHSGIYIHGLILKDQPIEIFDQNTELIRSYFKDTDQVPVNECKVIFLGDAESGKTHSIKRLLKNGKYLDDKDFKGESTPGIETTVSKSKQKSLGITINYWDFGGQEIQHSMHRMFLTERTVYVVFLNARQDDQMDERARYWLENVKTFAPNAPVLVVINKIDENDHPRFNETGITSDYSSQIKKVIRLSAKEDEPKVFLEKLQDSINSIVLNLPTVNRKIPRKWKNLILELQTMPDHYLTTKQFIDMCSSYNILDYKEIHDELVDLFQDIGVSFCYHEDRSTSDYMLLKPKWMLNALYTIVTNGKLVSQNGVISQNDLYNLLKNDRINGVTIKRVDPELRYEGTEVNYILGVIRTFRLSYRLEDGSEFFPMLCDGDEKKSVADIPKDALHFIFRYEYLPTNVIHRLIVDMQGDIDYQYVWYKGAVFRNEPQNQTAYVYSLGNDLHIYVYGESVYYNLNEYLTPISNRVRYINKSFGISAKEFITYHNNVAETELSFDEVMGNLRNKIFTKFDSTVNCVIDYRAIARRYDVERPISDRLLQSIIKALEEMQNETTYYRSKDNSKDLEDRRNRFVSAQLRAAGYKCNDQQTGGKSADGETAGKRDIVVKDNNDRDILVYEGLNTPNLRTAYIDKHITKLIKNYNPLGLRQGVLVVYLECARERFTSFSKRYRAHISEYAPENYICVGEPEDIPALGQFMTCMAMNYEVGEVYLQIYHIIVRVAP